MGKQVPPNLLQQIAEGKRREIEEDSFNNFNTSNQQKEQEEHTMHYQQPQFYPPQPPVYNQFVQNNNILRVPPQYQQFNRQQPPPHKFSPQYAAYIGAKPRAQASARVGMGGAF